MFKFLTVFSIQFVSLMLVANVAPPSIEYVRYDGGISDVPESIENSNTIYRDADLDTLFGIQHETIIYRATLEDDKIIEIVKFELDEENMACCSNYYRLFFSDHCVEPGKYLYISDLDCSKFENEFRSVQCQNYAEIEFEEPTDTTLCNLDKYEDVELTEDQIGALKSGMRGRWAILGIDEEAIVFNAEIGAKQDRFVTITNDSDEYKIHVYPDYGSLPSSPFSILTSDVAGSCEDKMILSPLESCTVFIRFEPEEEGFYEDYYSIYDTGTYYDDVRLTGRCVGKVSDDSDNETDEDNLNSSDDSEINDEQVSSESPDDVAESNDDQKSNDNSGELEKNDDSVIGEKSSDGCSVTVF